MSKSTLAVLIVAALAIMSMADPTPISYNTRGMVPYTGANQNVNLGTYSLTAGHLIGDGSGITGVVAGAVSAASVTAGTFGAGVLLPVANLSGTITSGQLPATVAYTNTVNTFTKLQTFQSNANVTGYAVVVSSQDGTPMFNVNGNGRVGIGVTNPAQQLEIANNILIGNEGFGNVWRAEQFFLAATGGIAQMVLQSAGAEFGAIENPAGDVWCGAHKVSANVTLGTDVLCWTTSNRVGVNTSAPSVAFDVVGAGKFSSTVAAGGGSNVIYYCSGSTAGTFDGNIARGNSNAAACLGGTWIATSFRTD